MQEANEREHTNTLSFFSNLNIFSIPIVAWLMEKCYLYAEDNSFLYFSLSLSPAATTQYDQHFNRAHIVSTVSSPEVVQHTMLLVTLSRLLTLLDVFNALLTLFLT